MSDVAHGAIADKFLYQHESRKSSSVVSNKYRYSVFFRCFNDLQAFGMIDCHRFFNIYRFSGFYRSDRIFSMTSGRCCNINCINIRIVYKSSGIVVEFWYPVSPRIILCKFYVSPHYGNKSGSADLVECRSAFCLSDISTSDDAPIDHSDRFSVISTFPLNSIIPSPDLKYRKSPVRRIVY